MKKNILFAAFIGGFFSGNVLANDLTGTWKTIDYKTGSAKAILEMRQESNGTYTAKIVKITPRPGYTLKKPVSIIRHLILTNPS